MGNCLHSVQSEQATNAQRSETGNNANKSTNKHQISTKSHGNACIEMNVKRSAEYSKIGPISIANSVTSTRNKVVRATQDYRTSEQQADYLQGAHFNQFFADSVAFKKGDELEILDEDDDECYVKVVQTQKVLHIPSIYVTVDGAAERTYRDYQAVDDPEVHENEASVDEETNADETSVAPSGYTPSDQSNEELDISRSTAVWV